MKPVLRTLACATALFAVGACGACGGAARHLDTSYATAQQQLRRGQFTIATATIDTALTSAREPDSAAAWRLRLLRAEVLVAGLKTAEAMPLLEQTVPAGLEFAALRGRQKLLLAQVDTSRGRLNQAVAALDEAATLGAADAALQMDIGVLGGQVRLRAGRWAEAGAMLNTVVATAAASGDHYRQALALNNLGMGFLRRNRSDEALASFERVLALAGLQDTGIYAAALNNAGVSYRGLGQFEKALDLQKRAVSIQEKTDRRLEYQQALGELGGTYLLQDDLAHGLPYLQRALAIATEAGLPEAALWARNLATAHVMRGEWDEAERLNAEARRLNPPNAAGKLVFSTVTAAQIAAGRGDAPAAERLFEDALAQSEKEPAVRWQAYDGLTRLAMAARQPARAVHYYEAALTTVEQTRSDLLRTDYKLSFLTRLIHFYRSYVDALLSQGQVDRALEVADSSRGRVLADSHGVVAPARVDAAGFRTLARRSNSALLFYWLAPERSLVWVVTGDGIRTVPLPPSAQLDALVNDYQDAIHNAQVDPLLGQTAGDTLYALLVAPLAQWLPPGTSVVIVPDGSLHRLNFETLPVPGAAAKHYWIEDVTVQIAPSLAMLTPARATRPQAPALLLIGDPTPRTPEFPALTYAAAEMSSITRHFPAGAVTAFQGAQASPAAFRAADLKRYSAIHFTSHAVANADSPLDSAVILSGPDDGFKLYARDVAALPLQADLVTVSACRSAGERAYSGEGLVGFAWAFLRAGSSRVVAGLWDVDDRSTAALMDTFYGRLAAGEAPGQALRNAKLALMRQGAAKPYYWGPLQMFTVSP